MGFCGCEDVKSYLDQFLQGKAPSHFDALSISDHVAGCAACHERFRRFFRTLPLPESEYLRETLDEMALALYNLGKAIIRDRPPVSEEDQTENVVITEEGGGGIQENLEAGAEMIEDAEDFTGSFQVGDTNLEELRRLLEDAGKADQMRIDLALEVFGRVTALDSRYTAEAWNWLGVLYCQKEDFGRAEAALTAALRVKGGATNVRSLAWCNLGYVHKCQGDLERALRCARKAVVLSEEDGKDPYFGCFALLYFLILNGSSERCAEAEQVLEKIFAAGQDDRLRHDLGLESNRPVRQAFLASPLASTHPEVLA